MNASTRRTSDGCVFARPVPLMHGRTWRVTVFRAYYRSRRRGLHSLVASHLWDIRRKSAVGAPFQAGTNGRSSTSGFREPGWKMFAWPGRCLDDSNRERHRKIARAFERCHASLLNLLRVAAADAMDSAIRARLVAPVDRGRRGPFTIDGARRRHDAIAPRDGNALVVIGMRDLAADAALRLAVGKRQFSCLLALRRQLAAESRRLPRDHVHSRRSRSALATPTADAGFWPVISSRSTITFDVHGAMLLRYCAPACCRAVCG